MVSYVTYKKLNFVVGTNWICSHDNYSCHRNWRSHVLHVSLHVYMTDKWRNLVDNYTVVSWYLNHQGKSKKVWVIGGCIPSDTTYYMYSNRKNWRVLSNTATRNYRGQINTLKIRAAQIFEIWFKVNSVLWSVLTHYSLNIEFRVIESKIIFKKWLEGLELPRPRVELSRVNYCIYRITFQPLVFSCR